MSDISPYQVSRIPFSNDCIDNVTARAAYVEACRHGISATQLMTIRWWSDLTFVIPGETSKSRLNSSDLTSAMSISDVERYGKVMADLLENNYHMSECEKSACHMLRSKDSWWVENGVMRRVSKLVEDLEAERHRLYGMRSASGRPMSARTRLELRVAKSVYFSLLAVESSRSASSYMELYASKSGDNAACAYGKLYGESVMKSEARDLNLLLVEYWESYQKK